MGDAGAVVKGRMGMLLSYKQPTSKYLHSRIGLEPGLDSARHPLGPWIQGDNPTNRKPRKAEEQNHGIGNCRIPVMYANPNAAVPGTDDRAESLRN